MTTSGKHIEYVFRIKQLKTQGKYFFVVKPIQPIRKIFIHNKSYELTTCTLQHQPS